MFGFKKTCKTNNCKLTCMDWMGGGGGGEERCTRSSHNHIWLCHSVTQSTSINLMGKILITSEKKIIKNSDYLTNIPANTQDTAAWVHSLLRCAKIQYHTQTHVTCFRKTAGDWDKFKWQEFLYYQEYEDDFETDASWIWFNLSFFVEGLPEKFVANYIDQIINSIIPHYGTFREMGSSIPRYK